MSYEYTDKPWHVFYDAPSNYGLVDWEDTLSPGYNQCKLPLTYLESFATEEEALAYLNELEEGVGHIDPTPAYPEWADDYVAPEDDEE